MYKFIIAKVFGKNRARQYVGQVTVSRAVKLSNESNESKQKPTFLSFDKVLVDKGASMTTQTEKQETPIS